MNRFFEGSHVSVSIAHRLIDGRSGPAGIVSQDPLGQCLGLLKPHAAVAATSFRVLEEMFLGRVVKINRMVIGEPEFHEAEGVSICHSFP